MKFRLVAASVALLVMAEPAAAASRRTQLADPPNQPADVRALHDFSRCAAQRWGERARAILAMDFRTEAYRTRIHRFARDQWRCFPNGMLRFGQVLFAGGMAEALLRELLAGGDLAALVAAGPADPPLQARDETELMSLCVVRAAPAKVAALLETEAGSQPESAALRDLIPEVSRCLGSGRSVRVNRVSLRALFALAAYRLVENRRTSATASAGAPAPDRILH